MSARLFFPAFEVSVGRKTLKSGGRGDLWRLEVLREVNGGADEAFLQLGLTQPLEAAPGDPVTVDLGYAGDMHRVFTGTVQRATGGLSGLEVHALGAQAAMMRKRGDKAFVNRKAGEVFRDLAGDAGTEVGHAEAGVDMPYYLADSSRTHWEHALHLGRHCGLDAFAAVDGKLVFAPLDGGGPALPLRFGADLLQAACETAGDPGGSVLVPESPASSAGDEAAHWIASDSGPQKGTAGTGGGVRYAPWLRTQEQAQAAADAEWARRKRDARRAEAEMTGRPEVELGDIVELKDLPAGGDGIFIVLGLRHTVGRDRGFRTYALLGGAP